MRKLLTTLLMAGLAAFVAGCGGGGSDTSQTSAVGPITFQVSGDEPELSSYPKLVQAYEEKTGQKVNLIKVGKGENFQKLTTAYAAGNPPDVFLASYTDFGSFAAKGALEPIDIRLRDSGGKPADYFPQSRDAFTRDGLQCMPQDLSSPVVFYNVDAFKKAGLAEPKAGWTYDDLKTDAQKLKESLKSQPEHFAVGFEPDMERLSSFVFAAGGKLVDNQKSPTGFTLDDPNSTQGLVDFFGLAPYAPGEDVLRSREPDELFTEGNIAMFIDSRMEVTKLREIEGFDWNVAPFPKIAKEASTLHSDGYCLSQGGNSEDGWKFIQFATGPEGQKLLADSGRIMPALKSVANSDAFLAPSLKPSNSKVFLDAIPGMTQLPNAPSWAGVDQASHAPIEESFFEGAKVPNINEVVQEFIRKLNAETAGAFKGQAAPGAGEQD